MSEENVEAFKRATAATNRGDVEGLLRELHPDVEFHAFLEELLGGEGMVYSGHAGVREFFRDFDESFDKLHWEYPDIRDLGDRVLAIGTFRARGRCGDALRRRPTLPDPRAPAVRQSDIH